MLFRSQLVHSLWRSETEKLARFVVSQNQYSILSREVEPELFDALRVHGLSLVPYFPLAGGFLTGKYRRGQAMPAGARLSGNERLQKMFINDARYAIVERLAPWCEAHGMTLAELAFRWLLACNLVPSVIAGASTPAQVEANAKAVAGALSATERAEVEKLADNRPLAFGEH
mgnify:FL=1